MDEKRAGIEEIVPVQVLPLVGHGPRAKALSGKRMRRRAKTQHVEEDRLAVAFPAVVQESAFWLPTVHERRAFALCPPPIDPAVERIGEATQFGLGRRIGGEIRRGGQHAGYQQCGVDQRQFRQPDALPALHVEKVEVVTAVAGSVRRSGLVAAHQEAQGCERARYGFGTVDPVALDADRVG